MAGFILRNRFFTLHRMPMIDSFSSISFDIPVIKLYTLIRTD